MSKSTLTFRRDHAGAGGSRLLEQVFINLLLNAMKPMPNGGTVDIQAEQPRRSVAAG